MRVLIKRDPGVPVVAMRAVWTGGLRLESPAENGISMLLAGLLTRGCGDRDAAALARRASDLSGNLSGVAGRNTFGLRAEWPAAHWPAGLALMADCILAPRFDAQELAREKRRLIDLGHARARSPWFLAFRTFVEALHPGHPYGMDMTGTAASVAGLGRRQVASFYQQSYPVSGLTLVVVGDVEPAAVMAQVRERFGRRSQGGRSGPGPEAVAPGRRGPRERGRPARAREVYRYLEGDQAHLVIGFPGTTVEAPDRHALQVLAVVLGGPGGRLREELKERRALAHRVRAVSVEGVEPGYLAVHLSCSPEALDAAFRTVRAELARITVEPVSPEELRQAQEHLLAIHAAASQQHAAVAAALAFHEAHGLGHERYFAYEDEIRAVDATAVQRVAAAYIAWDAAVTATVRPPDASPEAARRARGVKRRMIRRLPQRREAARARGQ